MGPIWDLYGTYMGPIWDLNIAYDSGGRVPKDGWVINYNDYVGADPWSMPFWWPRLLEDPLFRAAVKDRWFELRNGVMNTSSLRSRVDQAADFLTENEAITRNYNKWGVNISVDYNASVSSLKSFLEERASWMDGEISNF